MPKNEISQSQLSEQKTMTIFERAAYVKRVKLNQLTLSKILNIFGYLHILSVCNE